MELLHCWELVLGDHERLAIVRIGEHDEKTLYIYLCFFFKKKKKKKKIMEKDKASNSYPLLSEKSLELLTFQSYFFTARRGR